MFKTKMSKEDVRNIYDAKYEVWALEKLKNRAATMHDYKLVSRLQGEIDQIKKSILRMYGLHL